MLNIFRAADEDHNGYVNEVEMQHVLNGLGLKTSLKDMESYVTILMLMRMAKLNTMNSLHSFLPKTPNVLNEIHNQEHEAKGIPEGTKELNV